MVITSGVGGNQGRSSGGRKWPKRTKMAYMDQTCFVYYNLLVAACCCWCCCCECRLRCCVLCWLADCCRPRVRASANLLDSHQCAFSSLMRLPAAAPGRLPALLSMSISSSTMAATGGASSASHRAAGNAKGRTLGLTEPGSIHRTLGLTEPGSVRAHHAAGSQCA